MDKKTPAQAMQEFLEPNMSLRSEIEATFAPLLGICAEHAKFPWAGGEASDVEIREAIERATKYAPTWTLKPERIAGRIVRLPFGSRIPGGVKNLKALKPHRYWGGLSQHVHDWSNARNCAESTLAKVFDITEYKYWDDFGGTLRPFLTVHHALATNLQEEGIGLVASQMIGANVWFAAFHLLEKFGEGELEGTRACISLLGMMQKALIIGEKRDEPGTWVVFVKNTAG